ncbi:hypothetical protein D5272_15120 [bacterium D16-76]|nr:hypothetical protein [bacterium D16-76]
MNPYFSPDSKRIIFCSPFVHR